MLVRARKIILIISILGAVCFVAVCAVAVYFLQEKEKQDNTSRTEKARQARWSKKEAEPEGKEATKEEFADLEKLGNESQ